MRRFGLKMLTRIGPSEQSIFDAMAKPSGFGVRRGNGRRLMRSAIVITAFALASCSEPSVYEQVNWTVNHDHPYRHYAARDFRELKPGEPGNCAAIAYTKKIALERAGIRSTVMACRLTSGEGHAFLITKEGVLDNRFNQVVGLGDIGCQ
jgi:predicted transglutaminase-like cysteine proteinase